MEKTDIKAQLDSLYNHIEDLDTINPLELKQWYAKLQDMLGDTLEELEADIRARRLAEDGPDD